VTGEIGQLALCFALALSLVQGRGRADRRAERLFHRAASFVERGTRLCGVRLRRLRGAGGRLRHFGFQHPRRGAEFAHAETALLQSHRRVGKPRGLDASLGAGARGLTRCSRARRTRRRAAHLRGSRNRGPTRGGLPHLHSLSPRIRSCASTRRRSKAPDSIRFCRIRASRSIRRCFNFGYVGLSATFAYAAAALLTGEAGANWARAARPFLLAAWCALDARHHAGQLVGLLRARAGAASGFGDPVENASLMPWLVATALLHSSLRRNGPAHSGAGRCSSPSGHFR